MMNDDIVVGLHNVAAYLRKHEPASSDAVLEAADEIKRLRRWKTEATVVIEEWEAVWEAAGKPGGLGQSKPLGLMAALGRLDDEIDRLRAEVRDLTQLAKLLAGDHCYCIPGVVRVCVPCAYRRTMRQNEEARRG